MSEPVAADPAVDVDSRSRRVAPIIVGVVTLVIASFFVILIRAKSDTAESAYSPLVGKPAPSVRTTTLDGAPFDLQRRKGSWVVLNFFNATCGPCVQEHPELVKFAEDQAADPVNGAELYSVVWNDLDGGSADFFTTNKVSWTVLLDKDASIAGTFGVAKVPETWIIDPNGYVVFHTISALTDKVLTGYLNDQIAKYNGTGGSG